MYGYVGKILRVDLTEGVFQTEGLDEATARKWVGGAGLGTKYLTEEIKPGTRWCDPENRLIFTSGPLCGTRLMGSGTINVASKGPMTGMAGISQANGFMGAYLKFSGFDGIIFQGAAPELTYVVIKEGAVKFFDAGFLAGKNMNDTEAILREKLGVKSRDVSIFGIGPAGENRIRFAGIFGDGGHAAAHNGLGAVMGSKNLKAIVVYRSENNVTIFDEEEFKKANKEVIQFSNTFLDGLWRKFGTGGGFEAIYKSGSLPIKNYTETSFDEPEKLSGQYMREKFEIKSKPCYRCGIAHVKEVTVTEGPYKGFVGEEPEYEQLSAWGPQIGNHDLGAVVMLSNEVDNLGMDCNESGWVVGWAMECYEKGVFTKEDTEGLELNWGNVEAARSLLQKVAKREGKLGKLLADGVKVACETIGGEAAEWGVYTQKGASPRGHDHRGRWSELFDTCMANTGTIEATCGGVQTAFVDMDPVTDVFSHEEVSTLNAKFNGIRIFEDSLVACRFVLFDPKIALKVFNAATGWHWEIKDVQTLGLRIVNALRVFSFQNGLNLDSERPSKRYGSVPKGGAADGKDIMKKWDFMRENYFKHMGWDTKTGKPLPETLKKLGLSELIDTF